MNPEIESVFSPDRRYRYLWSASFGNLFGSMDRVVFVMLNPSTADEEAYDPTIRRCLGFAEFWGFAGIQVVNLFALRSTDPKALKAAEDPVGASNDRAILNTVMDAPMVVCAWGAHGNLHNRADHVRLILQPFMGVGTIKRFGLTKNGEPKHPLYLPGDAELQVYRP